MAYSEDLAQRIRARMAMEPGYAEKKMFGGLCFLLNGNMCTGITGHDTLMVRVGPAGHDEALAQPHAREMDFTGRPMTGMVFVDPPGFERDADLAAWVARGVAFTAALPPKAPKAAKATRPAKKTVR